LADEGIYDVWLLNTRGNIYSREHSWIDPDFDEEFWNFSFQEIGDYDLRATVDFIKNKKPNEAKINIIAYSQGTSALLYAMATRPELYASRVERAVALAPAVLFKNSEEKLLIKLAN